MQQYSYKNIDDKKSLQMLTYHSFETTGNMHNVHIYKKKRNFNRLSLFFLNINIMQTYSSEYYIICPLANFLGIYENVDMLITVNMKMIKNLHFCRD